MASTALLIGGLASAASSIGGAAIEGGAATKAASAQAQAAEINAQEQLQSEQNSLAFQQQQLGLTTANEEPTIQAGQAATNALESSMGLTPAAESPIADQTVANATAIANNGGKPLSASQSSGPYTGLVPGSSLPGVTPSAPPAGYGQNSAVPTQAGVPPAGATLQNNLATPNVSTVGAQGRPVNSLVSAVNGSPNPVGPNGIVSGNLAQLGTSGQNQLTSAVNPNTVAGGIGAAGTVGSPTPANPLATPGTVAADPLNTQGNLNATSLNEQWATPFTAPTATQAAATPGEQFELATGNNAIQNSAAAQGNLLSGGTLKGLDAYSQGLASTYYQQAYNNAMGQYQQNYNIFNNNQATQGNRLSAIAGSGQTAAANLGSAGANAANSVANTYQSGTNAITQAQQNAANATASGYVGAANAAAGGISGAANSLSSLALLNQLNQGSGPAVNQIASDPNEIAA